MTAQIKGFVTRADAGLRSPRSISRKITPGNGGCAPHYGGPPQPAAKFGSSHQVCINTWKAWQNYHMDTHGWSDIAYTAGFCNHGFVFAGRGHGIRTAANGTNYGNQNFYAFVWIGGEGQQPSQLAYDACDWLIEDARTKGAGRAVKPHRFFKSTGCPGDPFANYARLRDGLNIATASHVSPPAPASPRPTSIAATISHNRVDRERTKRFQAHLRITADGLWGDTTDLRARRARTGALARAGFPPTKEIHDVRALQELVGTKVDGVWGPDSQAKLHAWIEGVQTLLTVTRDGVWGSHTDSAFLQFRLANLNKF